MKILYVSDRYRGLSVYESQVHRVCEWHAERHKVNLLALCSRTDLGFREPPQTSYGVHTFFIPPKFFVPTWMRWWSHNFKETELFTEADVLLCRGQVGAGFALCVLSRLGIQKPILADIRGILPEEVLFCGGLFSRFFAGQIRCVERIVFNRCSFFSFVSSPMREHYHRLFGFPLDRCCVLPTVVDDRLFFRSPEMRRETRGALALAEDDYVYVYAGSMAKWQCLDDIAAAFARGVAANRKLFLLLLITQPDEAQRLLRRCGVPADRTRVLRIPHEQMGKFLNAGDAGLLIRKDNIVNRVASPVKLNEYRACGLRVVRDLEEVAAGSPVAAGPGDENYLTAAQLVGKQEEILKRLYQEFCGHAD